MLCKNNGCLCLHADVQNIQTRTQESLTSHDFIPAQCKSLATLMVYFSCFSAII